MLCIDLENGESMIDDERINERIQKEIELDEKRENDEKAAYEKKKEEIMNDASERDKALFQNAMQSIQNDINSFDAEMNKGEEEEGEAENQAAGEYAIHEGENANSKNNQFVAKVLENANMTQEEKERLLRNQEANLEQIKSILDKDKQQQE